MGLIDFVNSKTMIFTAKVVGDNRITIPKNEMDATVFETGDYVMVFIVKENGNFVDMRDSAIFRTKIMNDNRITIPKGEVEVLGISEGDYLRVRIMPRNRPPNKGDIIN